MRVIRRPHDAVDPDKTAVRDADIIIDVGRPHLPLEIFAGLQLLRKAGRGARAGRDPVHTLQVIGDPADIVLGRDDLQIREAVEHAREDQHAERFLDLVAEHGRAHIALAPIPLALDPHAGDRVQADRHVHFLRRRPERVVDIGAVGLLLRRRAPDHRAFQPHLGAAFEFARAGLRVVERDQRQPRHLVRRMADKLGEPVVVDAEAIGLEPGILQPEDAKAQRRVENVALDPVDRIVLDPLGRVPAARPRIGIGRLGQEFL